LLKQDKTDEAIAEFREAMRLDGDHVGEAPFALGLALRAKRRYGAALNLFLELRERVGDEPRLLERTQADWAKTEQDARDALTVVIRGELTPKDAVEGLTFAYLAYQAKRFGPSAWLFTEAFESNPKLVQDMTVQNRYNAACAAALAAAGKGDNKPPLTESERARWRKQALDWLKADLFHWATQVRSGPPQTESLVQQTLSHWKADTDLAGIRDEESLKSLPEADQKTCRSLWADVEALLRTALKR